MDDNFDNEVQDDSKSDSQPERDEIPLWLQGLEEQETEGEDVSIPSEAPDGQWIKENEEHDLREPPHFEEQDNSDTELPDWLNEMAQANELSSPEENIDEEPIPADTPGGSPSSSHIEEFGLDVSSQMDANQMENHVDILPENLQEIQQESQPETKPETGFIEISEFDIQISEDLEVRQTEMETPSSEEIPAESYEASLPPLEEAPSQERIDQQEFPTQPVPVVHQIEEEPAAPLQLVASELPPDQTPVTEDHQETGSTAVEPGDLPEDFLQAKEHMQQKNFSDAAATLRKYVAEASYLQQIKSILDEITDEETLDDSHFWELSGDVALKSNCPEEALVSYAKAIQVLLHSDRSK